jgi:AcrR family transcriptional regulator
MGAPDTLDAPTLEAGRRAFARFGYHAATLQRIAEEAGVSRVTLHRRGVTKEGILEALAAQGADRYRARLWPALTASGSALDRLEAALGALCQAAEDDMELLLALRSQSDGIFHEDEAEDALTRSVFTEPLERLLRDGEADGTLRAGDPAETATVLFNLVGWTYIHLRTGHRWGADRAREAVLRIALRGVV